MKVIVRKSAIKDLKKIDNTNKDKIKKAVASLENYPNLSQIKHLTNFSPKYRLIVGNYRILFDIEDDLIIVARILHRKESYR